MSEFEQLIGQEDDKENNDTSLEKNADDQENEESGSNIFEQIDIYRLNSAFDGS